MSSSKLSAPEIKGALAHLRSLLEFNDNKRPWGFLLTVSLAVGLPVVIATWLGDFSAGVLASMGGLSSVYLRQTPLSHRLITMGLVTFGFCASFVISLVAGFSTWGAVTALAGVAFWATFICRYFFIPAPGSFFFILVACIATATPFDLTLLTERAGLLLLGCLGASALVLIYSLIQRLGNRIVEVSPRITTEPRSVAIALEAGTIAIFIAGSYLLALQMGLEKPYWAPISCAAIMQGATFRAIWQRNVHRVVGTGIGMGLAWGIFSLSPEPWMLAGLVIVLSFCIEVLVTRNYGLAVVFVTPLTIILAEAKDATLDADTLIVLLMIGVTIGSTVGYVGGWVLHQRHYYARLESWLLRFHRK